MRRDVSTYAATGSLDMTDDDLTALMDVQCLGVYETSFKASVPGKRAVIRVSVGCGNQSPVTYPRGAISAWFGHLSNLGPSVPPANPRTTQQPHHIAWITGPPQGPSASHRSTHASESLPCPAGAASARRGCHCPGCGSTARATHSGTQQRRRRHGAFPIDLGQRHSRDQHRDDQCAAAPGLPRSRWLCRARDCAGHSRRTVARRLCTHHSLWHSRDLKP